METKICTKCGEEKELSDFNNRKSGKLGKSSVCKSCTNDYQKVYRQDNPDVAKRSYVKNIDKKKEYAKIYNLVNRKLCIERQISYRLKNPESSNKYYHDNKKSQLDKQKLYRAKNPDYYFKQDSYIVGILKGQGFEKGDITPELIETKRVMLKIKRLIKNREL